jgi:PAS domain S-box-containing protein
VIVYGRRTEVLRMNRTAEEILGIRMHALAALGDLARRASALSIETPDGRPFPVAETPAAKALRGETSRSVQMVVRAPGGRKAWVTASAAPVVGPGGTIDGAVATFVDVTAQKEAEDALRASEERFRQLANSMPQLVWTAEPDGTVDYYNDAAEGYSGVERLPDGRWRWEPVLHPDDLEPTRRAWADALRTGKAYQVAHRVKGRDGRHRWHLSRGVPVRDAAGRIVKWYGTATDIDDQKLAEEALRETDQRKNEFLAMLSHELRNPLAPIRNSVYLLGRAAHGGEQARRALAVIDRQVHHMTRLIDDLLDVTRISRGKIRLQRERVDLADLVHRVAEDHRSVFLRSAIDLAVRTGAAPLHADGDPTRLAQVIGNLLGNAAKFTPGGGRVVVSLEATDGGVASIRVRDTGTGIAPELLPTLFQPFVQGSQALDRSTGGLGLGLALVKGLVEMHGGAVEARSEGRGRGAEFTIRLPLAGPPQARASAGPQPVAPHPLRVLVIEDNADAADSLREVLELSEHAVEIAASGPEGLEKARSFHPEVVLCDIGLPLMDGFEVASRMRADPHLRSTLLVALSGYAGPEDVEKARAAGFDRHVAKPVDLSELDGILAGSPSDPGA